MMTTLVNYDNMRFGSMREDSSAKSGCNTMLPTVVAAAEADNADDLDYCNPLTARRSLARAYRTNRNFLEYGGCIREQSPGAPGCSRFGKTHHSRGARKPSARETNESTEDSNKNSAAYCSNSNSPDSRLSPSSEFECTNNLSMLKRVKNREAAARCRQRKSERVFMLEEKARQLQQVLFIATLLSFFLQICFFLQIKHYSSLFDSQLFCS